MEPTFSILIPTSGRADLIAMAVQSVREQTFRDFEIVIADLSGRDDVKAFAKQDPRIRYVFAPAGGLTTWDVAAKHARGKYMLWLDDDNYLLPFALELFQGEIDRTHADIISATHFYYYDQAHPRHYLRNSIGVIPFTGAKRFVEPQKVLEGIYAFARRGAGQDLPRFHFSATVIAHGVIERAIERLGVVLLADVPNIHSLQPIMFAFAQSCACIDWPVVIVGRLGVSMSQIWSTAARERFRRKPFIPRLSPVSGYARINGILENYLRVQDLLPERLGSLSVNYEHFALLYLLFAGRSSTSRAGSDCTTSGAPCRGEPKTHISESDPRGNVCREPANLKFRFPRTTATSPSKISEGISAPLSSKQPAAISLPRGRKRALNGVHSRVHSAIRSNRNFAKRSPDFPSSVSQYSFTITARPSASFFGLAIYS